MSSPNEKEPPKQWWLENACRVAAYRLRDQRYIGVNVIPLREKIRDTVEFVRIVWEEIDRHMHEEDESMMKSSRGNRLSSAWTSPHCGTKIDPHLSPGVNDNLQLGFAHIKCAGKNVLTCSEPTKLWPECVRTTSFINLIR